MCAQQMFPRQVDGAISHHKWEVDLESALQVQGWSGKQRDRIEREIDEMAKHFPRWLLTVSIDRERVVCKHCGGMLVFDRGLRCVQCETALRSQQLPTEARLAWFGLMPPIGIDGLTKLRKGLIDKPPPQHVVGQRPDIGHYLLVPTLAIYPSEFPNSPVRVAYLPGFSKIPGIPREGPSHTYHMLSNGFMCLFAAGEWKRDMTCCSVLQQRAYAHVIKLLNYGNGKRDAFAIVT